MNKRQKKLTLQVAEYLVAGGAHFWTGYFIIVFLTPVIGLWWANLLGNTVGLSVNFTLERYWVFKTKKQSAVTEASARYLTLTGCNFVINYLLLRALLSVSIPVSVGQFLTIPFFSIWNFIWYRQWVFKGKQIHHKRIHHHA